MDSTLLPRATLASLVVIMVVVVVMVVMVVMVVVVVVVVVTVVVVGVVVAVVVSVAVAVAVVVTVVVTVVVDVVVAVVVGGVVGGGVVGGGVAVAVGVLLLLLLLLLCFEENETKVLKADAHYLMKQGSEDYKTIRQQKANPADVSSRCKRARSPNLSLRRGWCLRQWSEKANKRFESSWWSGWLCVVDRGQCRRSLPHQGSYLQAKQWSGVTGTTVRVGASQTDVNLAGLATPKHHPPSCRAKQAAANAWPCHAQTRLARPNRQGQTLLSWTV